MPKFIDLTGKRFGRLTVVKREATKKLHTYWLCKCDCGKEKIAQSTHLITGHTVSCGCKKEENLKNKETRNGLSKTRLYGIWNGMKERCYNKRSFNYKWYGGRGISIYDGWINDFMSFFVWAKQNGYKEGLTIDRIDNNKNYEPSNCRWVTQAEQNRNKRNNKMITFEGKTYCLSEWSSILGVPRSRLSMRLKRGWNEKDTLFKPLKNVI